MLSAILIGFVNGARTFAAPAIVAWAAAFGIVQVADSRVTFLTSTAPAVILTALALLELAADKQPAIPSRKSPAALVARAVLASLGGAALASHLGGGTLVVVLVVGAAMIGAFVTYTMRAQLAQRLGRDLPAALLEDVAVIAVAALALSPLLLPAASEAETLSDEGSPSVAIATAFGPEFDALAPYVEGAEVVEHNGVTFLRGSIAKVSVVLFRTGISTVNAAMTTQLAIDRFVVDEIIVSGIAGSLDGGLAIGDVAVPARWGKYDEMVYLRDMPNAAAALPPGIVTDFPPFEFMAPRSIPVASVDTAQAERRFWYPADPALMAAAARAAEVTELQACLDADDACLRGKPRVHVGGSAVTGSVFLDNARFREYLRRTFDAQVVEMETAAIAQVAYANGVPYVAFRSVSDLAGGEPKGNEMRVFMGLAARNAATLVRAYLAERGGAG
ncbi:MAG: hypothetical protein AAF184_09345 [Pseudomonadota bacterium]